WGTLTWITLPPRSNASSRFGRKGTRRSRRGRKSAIDAALHRRYHPRLSTHHKVQGRPANRRAEPSRPVHTLRDARGWYRAHEGVRLNGVTRWSMGGGARTDSLFAGGEVMRCCRWLALLVPLVILAGCSRQKPQAVDDE